MDRRQTSDSLLAHFDQPKTLELPDFAWDEEILPIENASSADPVINEPACRSPERFIEVKLGTRRGVCWVLAWAAALLVFAVAASVFAEFAYMFSAERTLSVAARAGALEATLPRATYKTVTATIDRRLKSLPILAKQVHVSVLQNGVLVPSQFRQREGDQIQVMLSAPRSAAIPGWLRTIMFWRDDSTIQAHAEQQMPGRKLAYHATSPQHN